MLLANKKNSSRICRRLSPSSPAMAMQPQSQSVSVGQAVSFTVTATGTMPLAYQWRKNGTNIAGANGGSYAIGAAAASDAGNYDVIVSNSAGTVASNAASLVVSTGPLASPPTMATQPQSQSVNVGQAVSFTVTATGTMPLAYQWRKNGTNIAGANGGSYAIGAAAASDAGNYDVIISNSAGTVASDAASLVVSTGPLASPPTMATQPQSQSVNVGQAVSFTVTATGTMPLAYQWRKNGTNIAGANGGSYAIGAAAASDAGNYDVIVSNSAGTVASNAASLVVSTSAGFNFNRELFGSPASLSASVQSTNVGTGSATINGGDTRRPTTPFSFSWGDGAQSEGFFPQTHTYADKSRNYVVTVTAHYPDTTSDMIQVVVRLIPPVVTVVPSPASLAVTIPNQTTPLGTRQTGYAPPPTLSFFDDTFFSTFNTRLNMEYVLSKAAEIESSVLEGDYELAAGNLRQVVLRDAAFGGAYSLWYTTPVAFASGDGFFTGTLGSSYSSFFHEMGHNFTLNSPANYRYGGRIDGNANAIFSETVAMLFQHVVAFELVNNAASYGIPADLALDIALSAKSSMAGVRTGYEAYLAQGRPFSTWNDPATPADETLGTCRTLARQFFVHAEATNNYKQPLIRTMRLLRKFNPNMLEQYAPSTNSVAASTFRSTLMVAAISYGFAQDFRSEFRQLGFSIDDPIFLSLYNSLP